MSIDIVDILHATSRSKNRMDHILSLADDLINDPYKIERLDKSECKPCHYFSRVGGCAIVNKECLSCSSPVMYSSTNTSILCNKCAKEHSLCSHCGGDLNLRVGRRKV